ncbi:hypothetical protein RRG08_030743 [Elysia crispata]|uniref:Alpha-2-macroglobulin domain-containing protein n=1 Tax=Elysia crispata TaxID=231223 RepID=A0AAE0Y5E0_9GAST|nr:hypothetical protein RRG08_030743 [Elysia crispata]
MEKSINVKKSLSPPGTSWESVTTWNFIGVCHHLELHGSLSSHHGLIRLNVQKPLFADVRLPYKVPSNQLVLFKVPVYSYQLYPIEIQEVVFGGGGVHFFNTVVLSFNDRVAFSATVPTNGSFTGDLNVSG